MFNLSILYIYYFYAAFGICLKVDKNSISISGNVYTYSLIFFNYTFLFIDGIFESFSDLLTHIYSSPYCCFSLFINISTISYILCLLILISEVCVSVMRLILFLLVFTHGVMFPCVFCFIFE